MTVGSSYELVLAPPAVRAIRLGLPEAVAAAVIQFLTAALVEDPRRVGKPPVESWLAFAPLDEAPTGCCTASTKAPGKSSSCGPSTAATHTGPADVRAIPQSLRTTPNLRLSAA